MNCKGRLDACCMVSLAVVVFLCAASPRYNASARIVDATNWQEIQGLVPDQLAEWVKQGDFVLNLAELKYRPWDYLPDFAKESFRANIGRYKLDDHDVIVDGQTGKMVTFLLGFPFPEIDPTDPKAATKIMYNKQYLPYVMGFKRFTTDVAWVGRSGFEREVQVVFRDAYLTGFPDARKYPNPRKMERYSILSVRKPYDLAGTSTMLWRFLSNRADINFSYVPAIRRVRRTTPANRSDGFIGSDFCVDDLVAYDGKIPAFEWKLIGKKEALAAYQAPEPVRVVPYRTGGWMISRTETPIRYAFEEKGSTLAPWCPVNIVFAKRPAWIIEARAKDPYYNYGIQYMWIDRETWAPLYKVVYDRTGDFWKIVMLTLVVFESADGQTRFLGALDHLIIDGKRHHATYIRVMNPLTEGVFYATIDLNDFTLAGFQKFCK